MPFTSVRLLPGLNVERTPTLLEAGYAQTQLIRFRDGLAQKYGGWQQFYPFSVGGVPRDMHAWADLNSVNHLLIGTTTQLDVITSGALQTITPQTITSDFAPNFSTTSGSSLVTVVDPNISNITTNDAVLFDTPVSIGGLILSGLYPVVSIVGAHSYRIDVTTLATSSVPTAGTVPSFTTTSGSATVTVLLTAHGAAVGSTVVFRKATTGGGVTVQGAYTVATVADANHFTITVSGLATSGTTFSMNAGQAELVYYISQGPPATGVGYGLGGYGLGGYGTGVVSPNQPGTPISAADWSSDNWGQIALACPENGGVYYWDPNGGFSQATLVNSGPAFNGGIFVSTSEQILIAFASTIDEKINGGFGLQQDPMLVAWSDSGNFLDFAATATNLAGNFRIPIGSTCMAGMAVANQNLIWTDLGLWVMNFIGYPDTFGFTEIGTAAGACSKHSVQKMRGGVYWMGQSNFYSFTGGNVTVIPCPVWDFVFQNINTAHIHNVRAMPNTGFNEVGWLFPSAASANGENDSYVKFNISEPGGPWDSGLMPRSAWIDQSVLGPPIGAVPSGVVYQHETTKDAAGQPLVWSFQTGLFALGEGEDFAVIDQFYPDFIWGDYGGAQTAQVQITLNTTNYSGDPTTPNGPYAFSKGDKYIPTRLRARYMSVTVTGSDLGSFVRLGRCKYRYAPSGRR